MDPNQADGTLATGSLDLEQADFGDAPGEGLTCAHCGVPIGDEYYTLGDAVHCPRCHDGVQALLAKGPGLVGCVRAFGFGAVAAAAGAALWAGVTVVTGYEIGIIAIAVGWAVGMAVRTGSGGVGGVPYQLLAIAFTYLAIVASYVPLILDTWESTPIEELMGEEPVASDAFAINEEAARAEGEPLIEVEVIPTDADLATGAGLPLDESPALEIDAGAVAAAFVLAFALPFMMGLENAIGLLIIGIALWEAWRQTRRTQVEAGGPFRIGSQTAG
jgi:hypothetical protein